MVGRPITPLTDEEILNGIIEQMEKGVLPWRRPWTESSRSVVVGSMPHAGTMWPSNLRAPKVPYGVYNGIILLAQASKHRYRTNLWVTGRVLDELGATLVNSDCQATAIQRYANSYEEYRGVRDIARLVYNIDQVHECEKTLGLSFLERKPARQTTRFKRSENLRDRLINYRSLSIVHGKESAAYWLSRDYVFMPDIQQFGERNRDGEAHYWATLWHEVVHWTGHSSRLNRDHHLEWGDRIYAFEELIAELGSAFLCAHLGIHGELQHESYLDSWCRALKNDRVEALWNACKFATEAKDYVLKKEGLD